MKHSRTTFLPNTLHVLSTKFQLDVLLLTVHFGLQ